MIIIFIFLSLFTPHLLFSATPIQDHYVLDVDQKIFVLKKSALPPIYLYYSREEETSIELKFEDLTSLTIVEMDRSRPRMAAMAITDGGALLMGYLKAEESFLRGPRRSFGVFRLLRQVTIVTDKRRDIHDSKNYYSEYSTAHLWKESRKGDFSRYRVSESDKKYEETQYLEKLNSSSALLHIHSAGQRDPQPLTLLWTTPPALSVRRILPLKRLTLEILVSDLAEKQTLTLEAFEFETENAKGEIIIHSFCPSLFPLAYGEGLNGLAQSRNPYGKVLRQLVAVNRLKSDRRHPETEALSTSEKEELLSDMKDDAAIFFSLLQGNQIHADNIDQFIAVDELFAQLDGFPLDFSAVKTADQKIEEITARIDKKFDRLKNDLLKSSEETSDISKELMALEEKREEIKKRKITTYRERAAKESRSRRKVISNRINRFFREQVPPGITTDQWMEAGQFRLMSPDRGIVSFLKGAIHIHAKRYGTRWKIRAIMN